MRDRHIGKFYIDLDLIDNDPKLVRSILSSVIVLRAETLIHSNVIEYFAISPAFEEVPLGMYTPEYIPYICCGEFTTFERL